MWSLVVVTSLAWCGYSGCVDPPRDFTTCEGTESRCFGNIVQGCVNGQWQDTKTCVSQTCTGQGVCTGVCEPKQTQCIDTTKQACVNGEWADAEVCPYVCQAGACAGECVPGIAQCLGNTSQTCNEMGALIDVPCSTTEPLCSNGSCTTPLSCVSVDAKCGPAGDESCCAVTVVPGGTFNRGNEAQSPATVSDFRLDRFEITVGRFRKFVEAYPDSMPQEGYGEHPLISGSGWKTTWNMYLPANKSALLADIKCDPTLQTWTDTPGLNEEKPMNCLSWYDVFAFCAWDDGRLPTEAEWNYAAAGGDEQRIYSWGATEPDASYAVFQCNGNGNTMDCVAEDILSVGSKSNAGDGRWGQADLSGSMWEWVLDSYANLYDTPCIDCANLSDGADQVVRSGSWTTSKGVLGSASRSYASPLFRSTEFGGRCARNPP